MIKKKQRRTRKRTSGYDASKQLAFEQLETRQLLAGDFFAAYLGSTTIASVAASSSVIAASGFTTQQNTCDHASPANGEQPTCRRAAVSQTTEGEPETVSVFIGDTGLYAFDPSGRLGTFILDLAHLQGGSWGLSEASYDVDPLSPATDNFEQPVNNPPAPTPIGPNTVTPDRDLPTNPFPKSLPTSGPAGLSPISILVTTGLAPSLPAEAIGAAPTEHRYFSAFDQDEASTAEVKVVRTGLLAPYQSFGLLPTKAAKSPRPVSKTMTQPVSPHPTGTLPSQPTIAETDSRVSTVTQIKAGTLEPVVEIATDFSFTADADQFDSTRLFEASATRVNTFTATSSSHSKIGSFQLPRFSRPVASPSDPNDQPVFTPTHSTPPHSDGSLTGVDHAMTTSDDDPVLSLETAVFFAVLGGIQTQQPPVERNQQLRKPFGHQR